MVSRLREIKPLRDYLGDKKEMIEQMFLCIEENQLKKMIPDVLKEATLEDIKAECLVELLGMSKKRILGILEGKELDESSEDSLELSDISEDETPIRSVKNERKSPERNKKKKEKESKSSKSSKKIHKQSSSESDDILELEDEDSPPSPKKKKLKKKGEESSSEETSVTKTGKSNKKKHSENISKANKDADIVVEVEPEKKEGGKNLLEILELEMRARAIRALIEREEKKNKGENDEPSTSDKGKTDLPEPEIEEDDNDPDAVIVVDENVALQIDLTKDDSGSELEEITQEEENSKVKEKVVPNYRKHNEDIDSDKDEVGSEKISDKDVNTKESLDKTKDKSNSGDKASDEFIPRNWTERWLESNDVQKVMKTSKVLTNLKKRLINVNKQKPQEEKPSEDVQDNASIEGTVKEYCQLQTIKVYNQTNEDGVSNNDKTGSVNDNEATQISTSENKSFGKVDDVVSSPVIGENATPTGSLEFSDDKVDNLQNNVTVNVSSKSQEKTAVIVASPMLYKEVISVKDPCANLTKDTAKNMECVILDNDEQTSTDNDKTQIDEGKNDNLNSKDNSSNSVDSIIKENIANIHNEEVTLNVEQEQLNITNDSEDVLIISEECEIEEKEK